MFFCNVRSANAVTKVRSIVPWERDQRRLRNFGATRPDCRGHKLWFAGVFVVGFFVILFAHEPQRRRGRRCDGAFSRIHASAATTGTETTDISSTLSIR